ncbi:hypothetical protein ZIOFF_047710 [Zingiber officinale]|uniref:Uncharacterized protein n=1 Tax=Zingiber officinale TaxID=94328 RepID=A0A8J5G6H4_ZINOF|nr:hypothetical protein ZIOFF_047710 [Zingiber officinale]
MGFNVELALLASKVRGDMRLCCYVIFDGVYENLLFFPVIQLIKDRYFSGPEQQNTVSSGLGTNSNTANFKKHVDNKDLILSSPKPVAEANQQAFRASNGVSIILPFLISDHHRAGVLQLLSCLIIEDVLQVHPEELGALIEILKSDMITSVSGSQYKLQNDAKCDIITEDALLSCLRQSAHFFPLGLTCISKSASAATAPCSSTIIFLKSWTAERLNNVATAFSLASRAGIVPPSAMKDLFSFPVFAINRSSWAATAFTSCEPTDNCSTSINTVIRLALIDVIRLAANDVGSLNKASMFEVLIELLLFWKTNGLLPFFIVLVGLVDAGNLAGIYYEQSQLDMAILHYKQAINCDSTFIEAYNNLGNALKDAGHALKDVGHYRSCFALQPNHPQALSSLGSIYMDCNMMSVPASFYKATLAVTTAIFVPFNNLAIIYKQQTATDGLVNRGNTFKEIGRVTEAIQDYIRAVNIRLTMPEAHANLASAYKDSLQISSTPELKLMKCGSSGLNVC